MAEPRWDESAAIREAQERHAELVAKHSPPHPPLTVASVHAALGDLMEHRPAAADWHVHILDMAEDDGPEQPWDGLVTEVTTDCFDEREGLVAALFAWREQPPPRYQPPMCPECHGAVPQYHSRDCTLRGPMETPTQEPPA